MAPKKPAGGAGAASPVSASPASAWSLASDAPAEAPTRLTVALVRGLRGLRGQVRVELLTDRPADRFAPGSRVFVEGTPQRLTIVESSAVADGPGWWLRFKEIPSREAADTLRDRYLEIEPPAEAREPGRWFFHELVGLAVRGTNGEELGQVVDIYRAGGAEVFTVRGPRGEIDIPGVKDVVAELAPERGEMLVNMDNLDMDARPVDDEDYVRPRDRRPKAQPKPPKGPAQPPKGTANVVPAGKAKGKGSAKPKKAAAPAAPAEAVEGSTPDAAPDAAPAKPSKPSKSVRSKAPKAKKTSGTYTLSADEIAEAMAAAGKPMPRTALPKTPSGSSD